MEINVKNVAIMGGIAFLSVWLINGLLKKVGAPDLQA